MVLLPHQSPAQVSLKVGRSGPGRRTRVVPFAASTWSMFWRKWIRHSVRSIRPTARALKAQRGWSHHALEIASVMKPAGVGSRSHPALCEIGNFGDETVTSGRRHERVVAPSGAKSAYWTRGQRRANMMELSTPSGARYAKAVITWPHTRPSVDDIGASTATFQHRRPGTGRCVRARGCLT